MGFMLEVERMVAQLVIKGWTLAAIADELGVTPQTVMRWQQGSHDPANARPVIMVLKTLMRRKRIPKRKRYNL